MKPLELVYDKKGGNNVVGFLMEYLSPDFVPLSAYFNKNYCANIGIDAQFKFEIAKKMLDAVNNAHQNEIIIGDLSGLNILANVQKEVRFLDVDSYETPIHTHSHILFDEIRDYLYQGKVSKESDYFALSVVLFNFFTYLHPFRGVHKVIKAMAERMIAKVPIFAQDTNLILPKCYEALQDSYLQTQFEDIFLRGKRFLLQIKQTIVVMPILQTMRQTVLQTNLNYKEIYQNQAQEFIRKVSFMAHLGFVQTNKRVMLYDANNQGYLTLLHIFEEVENYQFFVGNKNLLRKNAQNIEVWTNQSWQVLNNIVLSLQARLYQMGDILVVLEQDFVKTLHLDEIVKDQISISQTPSFTAGFGGLHGMIQNAGGVQYLWFNSGKNLSTVKTTVALEDVVMVGNVGVAIYQKQQNNETGLVYEYFYIQDMKMKLTGEYLQSPSQMALKVVNAQVSYIFEAFDDTLVVRNASAQVLQQIPCSLLTSETALITTQAGIIAYEKDFVYLLNTKPQA